MQLAMLTSGTYSLKKVDRGCRDILHTYIQYMYACSKNNCTYVINHVPICCLQLFWQVANSMCVAICTYVVQVQVLGSDLLRRYIV